MTCGAAHLGFSAPLVSSIVSQAILTDCCTSLFSSVLVNLCGFLLGEYFGMTSHSICNSYSAASDALSIADSAEPSHATPCLRGIPVPSSNLASQASTFFTSATGISPTPTSSTSQGRPSYVVPPFIPTFPISSPAASSLVCFWDFLVSERIPSFIFSRNL